MCVCVYMCMYAHMTVNHSCVQTGISMNNGIRNYIIIPPRTTFQSAQPSFDFWRVEETSGSTGMFWSETLAHGHDLVISDTARMELLAKNSLRMSGQSGWNHSWLIATLGVSSGTCDSTWTF